MSSTKEKPETPINTALRVEWEMVESFSEEDDKALEALFSDFLNSEEVISRLAPKAPVKIIIMVNRVLPCGVELGIV